MKKLTSLIFAIVLCITLAGCTQEIDDLQTVIAQKEAEIASLNQQLTEKEGEIAEFEERAENAESNLTKESAARIKAQQKIADYEKYFNELDGCFDVVRSKSGYEDLFDEEQANLYYKEGSIALETRRQPTARFAIDFERKYRYSYYYNSLPMDEALKIVRGEDYIETPTRKVEQYDHSQSQMVEVDVPISLLPEFTRMLDLEEYDALYAEPVMHSYLAWVIQNYVSKQEMEEVVEILSDINHPVYDNWTYSREEIDFNHEFYELPNVDVLYTFNQDYINEYYRYA